MAQEAPVTFRASTAIVLVPVWVKEAEKLVQGLTAPDFEVTDNGVRQDVGSIATASQPVDVTAVLDTSGSLDAESLARLTSGIQTIGKSLTTGDRIRLLAFGTKVTEVFGFQNGGSLGPIDQVGVGGTTALYDAIGAALLTAPRTDRAQLVFAVTDGLDNASTLKAADVVSLAGVSSASLYVTIVRTSQQQSRDLSRERLWVIERMREASARTGGLVFESPPDTTLPALFAQVVADFRTSYLLSFTPRGVPQDGWHELVVRTKNGRYSVRARAGYQR